MDGARGRVFGPIDWDLKLGERAVIVGQQGAGRSALLLALGGRLRGVQGTIMIDGFDGVAHPRKLRRLTSVARIAGFADLEPRLTIEESRDERCLLEGFSVREGRKRFEMLQDLVGAVFEPRQQVGRLPAVQRTLLTALLGCLRPARYVLLDDIGLSLTEEQLGWIYQQLDVLEKAGATFVVSALDEINIGDATNVLRLAPPPSISQYDPDPANNWEE